MIEVRRISKTFNTVRAVDSVSFTTQAGGIFGLIGPNGAGKSTTIRMIMNILAPDSGEILFSGKRITEKDKGSIGYLPEERGLYKKVKVGEILSYFGGLKSDNAKLISNNIDLWLEKFGLREWKNRKVEELSKGMSQKVQFIASLVHEPQYIFFDEPFSGLDPVSSDLLRDTILDLGKQGKTILFSTHIMDQAEKLCSSIFLINKGREVLSGSIEEIKNTYGKGAVILEFDGNGDFIEKLPFVSHSIRYPRYMEIELKSGTPPNLLLESVYNRVSLRKFEIVSPSLHKIFIDLVGEKKEIKE